jgi:hypothetical protein
MRIVTFSSRLYSPTPTRGVHIIGHLTHLYQFASRNSISFVVRYLSQTFHKHKCKHHAKGNIDKTIWKWVVRFALRPSFQDWWGPLQSLTVGLICLRTSLQVILSPRWESRLSQRGEFRKSDSPCYQMPEFVFFKILIPYLLQSVLRHLVTFVSIASETCRRYFQWSSPFYSQSQGVMLSLGDAVKYLVNR